MSIHSKVRTLAFKCYDEQIPGQRSVYDQYGHLVFHDPDAIKNFIQAIHNTDPKLIQVLVIRHNRDEKTDGIWAVSTIKAHWHGIIRLVDPEGRLRVGQILAGLGIVYRPGLDDELWKEHGVETIGNFAGYAMYLTHETTEAIHDAKERYDISEIISNLSPEEIQQVRDGYIRVSEKRKLTQEDLIALDKEAYDRGYALKTLDDWFASQPFNVRSAAKIRVITEHYYDGVEARISEHKQIDRVCIYISGQSNKGKTYAAEHALLDMGLNLFRVKGGGTGKFDDLSAAHDAILIDDDTCPNLLNMTDDYICRAYKRGRNNPPWAGKILVVTSNMQFCDWLDLNGMNLYKRDKDGGLLLDNYGQPILTRKGKGHVPAMMSRFFRMHIETDTDGVSHLELDAGQGNLRGSVARQQAKIDMAADFRAKFNAIIREYRPQQDSPDWTDLCVDTDRAPRFYQCGRCKRIDVFTPELTVCLHCGAPVSADMGFTMSESKFLDFASEDLEARSDALTGFACAFWTSVEGGMAWHMKKYPEKWEDPGMEVRFANDDAMLAEAVKMCDLFVRGYSDGPSRLDVRLIQTFPMAEILDAVKYAWNGGFGDLPPLTEAFGYLAWASGADAAACDDGHKICHGCWRVAPPDVQFCGCCGKPLPDHIFKGDCYANVARLQLAAKRGCDATDIPDSDVSDQAYRLRGGY